MKDKKCQQCNNMLQKRTNNQYCPKCATWFFDDDNVLLSCPFCGRKAVEKTEEITLESGLVRLKTIIHCEGKIWETKDKVGCNAMVSASNRSTAIRMWNTRQEGNDEV